MKRASLLFITFAVISLTSCKVTIDQEQTDSPQTDYFQLKIFTYETAEQEALLDAHFQNALLPALHRSGIKNVGVFKPIEGLAEQQDLTMILVPFQSMEELEQLPELLKNDSEYKQTGQAYIDAPHDSPPYTRIESMILRSFSATPQIALPDLSSPRSDRVYELRSYEAATEKLYKLKVEMFNEGESALFQELNFNPVFFCEVLSSAHMPHLMYMTTHADTIAQKENWDAFRVHPEWERMKNLDRYQNTVSSITKYLLYPTEYSDY
ncbi:MAG: NIPSNAP family protein [Bacteroidota bacterium]|nr:NIPSNAP family protein [Bacteroidota bacterium]